MALKLFEINEDDVTAFSGKAILIEARCIYQGWPTGSFGKST